MRVRVCLGLYAFAYKQKLYVNPYKKSLYVFACVDKLSLNIHICHMDAIIRTTKQIGDAVKRIRRQRNLTQEALGQRIHARQATISKLNPASRGRSCESSTDTLAALDLELLIQPRSKASPDEIEDSF